jgi:hypothetical protein
VRVIGVVVWQADRRGSTLRAREVYVDVFGGHGFGLPRLGRFWGRPGEGSTRFVSGVVVLNQIPKKAMAPHGDRPSDVRCWCPLH